LKCSITPEESSVVWIYDYPPKALVVMRVKNIYNSPLVRDGTDFHLLAFLHKNDNFQQPPIISVISWWSVLLVGETGVPIEKE
jgi:hypothetical protein